MFFIFIVHFSVPWTLLPGAAVPLAPGEDRTVVGN